MNKIFLLVLLFFLTVSAKAGDADKNITVYKSPTCGCCTGWVAYLEDHRFTVETHDVDTLSNIKAELGLTDKRLMSCHTATINGFVVEGHVPANDIQRLIDEKPDILGITAPGMPKMSPGMGSRTPKDYKVLAFDKQGKIELFSQY